SRRARCARPWSSPGHHRPIAGAPDRRDVTGPLGSVAELVAKPADVDVDRAVEGLGRVVAIERVEQGVAREDPPLGLDERDEEAQLRRRERQYVGAAADLMTLAIDLEVGEAERPPRPAGTRAPQDRLHADDGLGGREG